MLLNYQITIGCTILGMIKNFLAIPRKLYIPRMTVVGNKSMNFANLGQCKLNSFANKNVCKQDDLMLSQVKWIINWGKFTNRRQRSLSSYRTSILTLNCMILSSLSDRDTYRRWGSGHTKVWTPPSQQRSALKKKMSSKPRRLCTILYHRRDLCGFRTLALDNVKKLNIYQAWIWY